MRVCIGLLVLALVPATALSAQTIPKDFVTDFKAGISDVLATWAAPFRGDGRDYVIGVTSLGVIGGSAVFDERVANWMRANPDAEFMRALRPLRQGQGDAFVQSAGGSHHAPGALAVYTVGLLTRQPAIRDLGMGCLAAAETHMIVRQGVYALVSRERPIFRDTVNGEAVERAGRPYHIRFPGERTPDDNSFFSGHAASVFSCVTFINTRFQLKYAEPVLWAFAGGLAAGRAADQRHYVSDVLLGSLIGYSAGRFVGQRSLARMEKRATTADAAAQEDAEAERSWVDGVYVTPRGQAMVVGWRARW